MSSTSFLQLSKARQALIRLCQRVNYGSILNLLRNGTLPEVWIPPSELRDQRELLRLRIFLVRLPTREKNRIHGTLSRLNGPFQRDMDRVNLRVASRRFLASREP